MTIKFIATVPDKFVDGDKVTEEGNEQIQVLGALLAQYGFVDMQIVRTA